MGPAKPHCQNQRKSVGNLLRQSLGPLPPGNKEVAQVDNGETGFVWCLTEISRLDEFVNVAQR